MIEHFAAFLGVATLVIVTPGPDTALTVRNALRGGRRAGILTGGGVATGQTVWAFAAGTGVAALLALARPALHAVRLAGALYLVVLGAESLWAAARVRSAGANRSAATPRLRGGAAYRQGVLNDLGNPKMAVFFLSLLPQFVAPGAGELAGMLALGLLFAAMTFAWLAAYSVVVARFGDALRQRRARRLIDAVCGAALVGLGLRIATEHA